jgi:hypothetical protein
MRWGDAEPAGQKREAEPQGRGRVAPGPAQKKPASQGLQPSGDSRPGVEEAVPGGHSWQEPELSPQEPGAQGAEREVAELRSRRRRRRRGACILCRSLGAAANCRSWCSANWQQLRAEGDLKKLHLKRVAFTFEVQILQPLHSKILLAHSGLRPIRLIRLTGAGSLRLQKFKFCARPLTGAHLHP